MKDVWDACIVGAGPAGCAAAVQLTREGFKAILVEKGPRVGGLIRHAWRVENCPILAGQPSGAEIAKLLDDHIAKWGIEVHRMEVRAIERTGDERFVIRGGSRELEARAVIVCVGTVPRVPTLAVPDGVKLCFYPCDVHPNAKRAAIVGGGDAAFDYALSLAERGVEPAILVRSNRPRALKRLQNEVESRNIKVHLGAKIIMLEKAGDSVRILLQSKGVDEDILADSIVAAIGRKSARGGVALMFDFKRSERSNLPTSSGIWLAGDVWRGRIRQMSIAVGDGVAAAMEAAEFLRERGGSDEFSS